MSQQSVRRAQTTGFIGEIIEDGPKRAFPKTLNSTSAANNIFGRVFTHVSGEDNEAKAGGVVADFAGILSNPKLNVTQGTSSGALDPSLTLRNGEIGQLVDMAIMIVSLASAASINGKVYYDPIVGNATAGALSAVQDATYTDEVPNCKVVRHNTTGAGLAFIQLTN